MRRSKSLSWRLKLSDWLSGGLLTKYRREMESSKSKLQQVQINVDNLKKQLQHSQREAEQAKAQLLMAKGFQVELGETQFKLKEANNQLLQCQQQLKQKQREIEQISTKPVTEENKERQLQTTIDILDVKRLPQEDFDSLWGFSIASPKAGTKIAGDSIPFQGWVLGKKTLATTLRINHHNKTLVETPVNLPSPGVTQYYPDIAAAGKSGFKTSLSVGDIPAEAELEIQVLLENQDIINLSVISIRQ